MKRIELLDHGYVQLIETWGSDKRFIESARMSTDQGFKGWGPRHDHACPSIWPKAPGSPFGDDCTCTPKPGDEKLLAYLYNNKHSTPFEMGGMILEVKAPIFVFREWHRHRTQSYNEMSARYIPLPDENYIPSVERLMVGANTATTNKQAQGSKELIELDALGFQDELAALYRHAQRVYERGLGYGVPKELARLPVPVARYSRMRASANIRNWLAFLTLRLNPAAQWEIRQYAEAVGTLVAENFPRTWALFDAERTA